ncbi:tryptophan-rich sensory protein [Subsaximicrobium wynnwilliamsii]|uniref:Tryptophan-rich sensory protein n=1 Tax=Subsaximicrobium wynnwilliamsii TaxID=291179 RepID=A0A5C6ZBH3_9FLAO|nr:TspO/MBR family protein [Subsaximicrobium wynnwilliamsii]TXD80706.1 tryptophan-rich sensory protein [Subsaximicrobium wynnwilliamsii]TXD86385.1 tryptophan-rich sensory protein [Subsaximicrobium wynnwilliamsii]TXD99932.1 tryptophan-rich sensory protein [Subsaximicrobium wynnwilliamsii]
MKKGNLIYLLLSTGICVVFAIIGGLLVGNSLENWFTEIKHPWFSLPMIGWYIVGGLYYIMAIAILYRLLIAKDGLQRRLAICLTIAMIAGNEFWNYLFFGLESTYAGFIGLIPFTLIVVVLFVRLWKFQQRTAWILLPYVIWLGYDIIWTYNLWILNK